MTEQAKVPSIRFAGFTDPWEQRKLGELSSEFQSGDFISAEKILASGPYPVYGGNGLRGYAKRYNHDGFYALIGRQGALCGNVNTAVGKAYFTEHAVAIKANSLHDTRFLVHLLRCMDLGQYSGQSAQPGLAVGVLKEVETTVPSKVEQQAIGSFFSRLDDLITLHQRKYDKLVIFKKSMLEKMFPKDGESVPEIRFAGFTDPWEQRKLGDVASSFDYGLNAAATEYDGQNKYLRITDIDDETHEFSKSDLTTPLADLAMSADYLLKESDLLFARTGASVGKTYLYRQFDGMVYFAGFLIRARIGEGADPEFAYQATLTDAYKKYVAITSQRSGQPGVNAQEYADYQLMLPSKTEQQQIGMTLRSLDDLITLHQRKLELLRNIKKSLLDKMFV